MSEQSNLAFAGGQDLSDPRALTQQLGSAEELTTLGTHAFAGELTRIRSLDGLREFLASYKNDTLGLLEFQHIYTAWSHASRNELRELLAFDQKIGADPAWKDFKAASHNVGKRQLNKLRPLKDNRFIQRYRQAVLEGKAHAWHTLVYGVVLATYSIPLRQGMFHYAQKTVEGFIQSAARSLVLTEATYNELLDESIPTFPSLIEGAILSRNGAALKLIS